MRVGVDVAIDFCSQGTILSEHRDDEWNYSRVFWLRRITDHQSAVSAIGLPPQSNKSARPWVHS
jgi:hypothetical protein